MYLLIIDLRLFNYSIMILNEKTLKREQLLKTKTYDELTKSDIRFLEDQKAINWVWAEWQGPIVRYILTKVFCFLEYKRHDFVFWKGWTIKDFHDANWWLLKYSFLSLAEDYRKLHKKYKYSKIWRSPLFIVTAMIKTALIIYAYRLCESDIWKEAFNFHK